MLFLKQKYRQKEENTYANARTIISAFTVELCLSMSAVSDCGYGAEQFFGDLSRKRGIYPKETDNHADMRRNLQKHFSRRIDSADYRLLGRYYQRAGRTAVLQCRRFDFLA